MRDDELDADVLADIAAEAARRYGPIADDTPRKVRRNLRRRSNAVPSLDEVRELLEHYKAIYGFAASILTRYLDPPTGKYCDWKDVRREAYLRAIARKFPRERRELLEIVADYAIFYEYLK